MRPRHLLLALCTALLTIGAAFGLAGQVINGFNGPGVSTGSYLVPVGPPSTAPLGPDDGQIGDQRVTAEDDVPAITGLAPGLREALAEATGVAADDGITVLVTSGWRSARYQQHLLDEAVDEYGSMAEARRWVATPETSAHVTGDAVDVGPTDAALWMAQHGWRWGLCQVYANEIWHYELLIAPGGTCPGLRPDSAS